MITTKKGQIYLFPPPELNEYFILISPPDEIKKEAKKLKNKLYKITGNSTENKYSIAHISLFKTKWEKDEHVLKKLRKCLEEQKKFSIEINNAAVFEQGPKKRTLYLKIENQKPIISLFEFIADEFKIKNSINPHLTIEQNMTIEDFSKIENDLSVFNYQNQWICDRITVLKRHKIKGTYKTVDEIIFE